MKTVLAIFLVAVLVLSITTTNHLAYAKQNKADKKAEKIILKKLDKFVGGHFAKYCSINATTTTVDNSNVYGKDCTLPPTPTPVNSPPVPRIATVVKANVGDNVT